MRTGVRSGIGSTARWAALAGAVAVLTMTWSAPRTAQAAPGGTGVAGRTGLPTLRENLPGSGLHGRPWLSVPTTAPHPIYPTIDLRRRGYVEREFVMSGRADEYQEANSWGSDGEWAVSVAQAGVPYSVRLLVRYPTAAAFNGTVVFEWLNESNNFEADPIWAESYHELLAKGYAYVGVDAQTAGQTAGGAFLKGWDPVRYGSLSEPSDAQSYDIFTQAADVVRADHRTILGGLDPVRLLAAGDSQSAFRLVTYINAFQAVHRVFDGFLLVGRSSAAAPVGDGVLGLPVVAYIRPDDATPILIINSESDIDVLQAALARQADTTELRTWEIAGASHIDLHEGLYELSLLQRDDPALAPPTACLYGVSLYGEKLPDNLPLFRAEDGAVAALRRWTAQGVPPAHGTPITTLPILNTIVRDAYGNALGGVRLPDVEAPVETMDPNNLAPLGSSVNEVGLCLFFGYNTPFASSTLEGLYPSHATYVAAYTTSARQDERSGFLTPADTAAEISGAESAPVP